MSNWLVVQTKPHAMALAVDNLHRQGFATFLPLERKTQRRQNRLLQITKPYFGNYLFVSAKGSAAPVSQIRSTYGVSRIVEFGGSIAQVPEQSIVELKSRCDGAGCLQFPSATQAGDSIRVIGGPFHDQLGRVEQMASNERVWVLLDILGQKNRTLVSRNDLAKV
jgi:transcriptional antiterminator RfaH